MRKLSLLAAAMFALAAPTFSHAQVTLGLRLGFAPAGGDAFKDDTGTALKMSDGVKSQIPVQLDALYRLNPNLAVGGYFSYGFGQTGDICSGVSDCSANDMRLGVQATYKFAPMGQVAPWAGVGIGYEWSKISAGADDVTFKGWEFLNLTVGGDFAVAPQFSVGPYVGLSIGQYGSLKTGDVSVDVPKTTVHEWFQVGFRGTYDL